MLRVHATVQVPSWTGRTCARERLRGEANILQASRKGRGFLGACCCARRAVRQAVTRCIRPVARCEVRVVVQIGFFCPPRTATESLTQLHHNSTAQATLRGARSCAARCLRCQLVRRRRVVGARCFAPLACTMYAVGCAACRVLAGAASAVQQQTRRAVLAACSDRRRPNRRGGASVRR